MEVYDYTNENDDFDKDSLVIDTLNNKQLKKLSEAIKIIQMDSEKENISFWSEWFNSSILVILKEFSEITSSKLEIDREDDLIFCSFRNKNGFDITDTCILRFILTIFQHISITSDNEESVLTLTFDCNKYI